MKTIKKSTFVTGVLAVALALVAVVVPVVPVSAQGTPTQCDDTNLSIQSGIDCTNTSGNLSNNLFGTDSVFTNIINALLFIIGAISVVMLIYGGIRYTTSGGAKDSVTAAKNTIMYAIIGIVVAFLAFAVVNWVLGAL